MRRPRSAYTLFQLLVLLAFLLLLMAMMLPATLQVRIAAARMQSQNNLKQIGLAMHNYHDVNNGLPAGVDANGFSGLVPILPYIEQELLLRKVDLTTSPENAANDDARTAMIKIYMSPLDEAALPSEKHGPTSYFLVAGAKTDLERNNGIFFSGSKSSLNQITDGTSYTIWCLESLRGDGGTKAVTVARQHVELKKEALKGLLDTAGVDDFNNDKNISGKRGMSWLCGKFLSSTMSINRLPNDSRPDVDCGGAGGYSGPRSERGGVTCGFADGSVRFATKSLDLDTWKALATRDGGEVVNFDF